LRERRAVVSDRGIGVGTALQPSSALRGLTRVDTASPDVAVLVVAVTVADVVVVAEVAVVTCPVVVAVDPSPALPHATSATAALARIIEAATRRTARRVIVRGREPGRSEARCRAGAAPVTLRAVPISSLIAGYDHILLDLDGCVWLGDEPTAGAVDAIAALRSAGKNVAFVTNDTQLGTEEYVQKLWRLGFQASLEEVVTAGGALQFVLAERFPGSSAVVIGSPALHRHVIEAGLRIVNGTAFASRADVAVVAFHPEFHYDELRDASQAARRGAFLIGSNRDASFPMPDGLWPGSGSIIAAVETASGCTALTVGKPEPVLVQTALDRLGPGRALMVGDRLDADLGAAHAAGVDGAIVLTGASDRAMAEAARDPRPVAIAERLETLVLG
jgi:HAD superfamily hydrolase (TIGR01450 family)